jgi:uncharacterized protein
MRALHLIASALLAITAAPALTHVGGAEVPAFDCAQLSHLLDDDVPLAVMLEKVAVKNVDPSQAETACREALRADPINPNVMFSLARAVTLASRHLEAIKYYLDAADRGHVGAMNDLGGVFEHGIGVPKNMSPAIEWYERAAGLGHAGAMIHLGQLNENGVVIPQDLAAASRWYQKAATLGNAAAMNFLADLFRQAGDPSAAGNWYVKAAQQGRASAMNSLGEFSEAGTDRPQDYASARNWYQKAAALGHADAMGNLGALLESGRGGPQNLEAAREWYVKGAALNGRVAMHHLGAMLESGRGTAKNLSEAKLLYERAAALGYPPALNDLGRLYAAGAGAPKNYERAKSLFEQASALGDAKVMNNLGMLYLEGRGVPRDIKVARTWFEQAMTRNNAEAQENLKRLDQVGLTDGTQVAARRGACIETCAELHRSYVSSVCDRFSSTANVEKPERTKCIDMSLTLARQCRETCREWAPTLSAENRCLTCFSALIACSVSQKLRYSPSEERPYAVHSGTCLASQTDCMAKCSGQASALSGTAN